jgi:hypothetical protein
MTEELEGDRSARPADGLQGNEAKERGREVVVDQPSPRETGRHVKAEDASKDSLQDPQCLASCEVHGRCGSRSTHPW